jgi:hypothetical protein
VGAQDERLGAVPGTRPRAGRLGQATEWPKRTPRPRSLEPTRPSRLFSVRNVATPMESAAWSQEVNRKGDGILPWDEDGPRSACHQPQGTGNPSPGGSGNTQAERPLTWTRGTTPRRQMRRYIMGKVRDRRRRLQTAPCVRPTGNVSIGAKSIVWSALSATGSFGRPRGKTGTKSRRGHGSCCGAMPRRGSATGRARSVTMANGRRASLSWGHSPRRHRARDNQFCPDRCGCLGPASVGTTAHSG